MESADELELVKLARVKLEKLLQSLRQTAADAARPVEGLSPEAAQAGAWAMQKAIEAAARTETALQAAELGVQSTGQDP